MRFFLLSFFLIAAKSSSLFAQETKEPVEEEDSHAHHKNEIGIAIAPVYFINEKVFTYSIHVHYTYNIEGTKFGVGLSFERIVLPPKHSTYGLVFTYRPIERLSVTMSPGVTSEDSNPGTLFALHIETAYEFEIGSFHIGPALEFAYDPNDYHLSLGIHVGYGF